MPSVKTCPFDPAELVRRYTTTAPKHGFRVETFGMCDGVPLIALTKRHAGVRPRIYLSAGIHGDEPAPPLALLQLLDHAIFDDRAHWFLVPLLNPNGFRFSQRENLAGIDLNRDYLQPFSPEVTAHVQWLQTQPRFDLALCLHEDWESTGFYLCELNPDASTTLAPHIREAAETVMPIEQAQTIDGRPIAETGIIRPESDPLLRADWPEAIYLRRHHAALGYTLETSSSFALDQRIATQCQAVKAAIQAFTAG